MYANGLDSGGANYFGGVNVFNKDYGGGISHIVIRGLAPGSNYPVLSLVTNTPAGDKVFAGFYGLIQSNSATNPAGALAFFSKNETDADVVTRSYVTKEGHFIPAADNAYSLGSSGYGWNTVNLYNLRLKQSASAPACDNGVMYLNTANQLKVCLGGVWKTVQVA